MRHSIYYPLHFQCEDQMTTLETAQLLDFETEAIVFLL